MDEVARLIRQLIVGSLILCVLVVLFFFVSAQVQLSNRQAAQAADDAATCHRWATHTQDRMDELIGKLHTCR